MIRRNKIKVKREKRNETGPIISYSGLTDEEDVEYTNISKPVIHDRSRIKVPEIHHNVEDTDYDDLSAALKRQNMNQESAVECISIPSAEEVARIKRHKSVLRHSSTRHTTEEKSTNFEGNGSDNKNSALEYSSGTQTSSTFNKNKMGVILNELDEGPSILSNSNEDIQMRARRKIIEEALDVAELEGLPAYEIESSLNNIALAESPQLADTSSLIIDPLELIADHLFRVNLEKKKTNLQIQSIQMQITNLENKIDEVLEHPNQESHP